MPALSNAVAAEDVRLAWMSITVLNLIAKADESVAEAVVKVFRPVFTDKRRPESVREVAIRKVMGIGPAARWAIPDLVDLLEDPKTSAILRRATVDTLADMGPRAAPAVPTLIRLLETSAAQWEQLRAAPAHRVVGSAAFWLDGWDRWRKTVEYERGRPPGFPSTTDSYTFDEWMTREVENDLSGILRALKAAGPAAAPAIEPLKRFLEKVRYPLLEKDAYDALVEIEK